MTGNIKSEDLVILRKLKTSSDSLKYEAEISKLESEIADLKYQNALLVKFVEYGLTINDTIDYESGIITKQVEENNGQETISNDG